MALSDETQVREMYQQDGVPDEMRSERRSMSDASMRSDKWQTRLGVRT